MISEAFSRTISFSSMKARNTKLNMQLVTQTKQLLKNWQENFSICNSSTNNNAKQAVTARVVWGPRRRYHQEFNRIVMKWIINGSLSVACLIHISIILHNYLNPDHSSVFIHDEKLRDLEFPLIFKFCFNQEDASSLFQSWGYETFNDFYRGISMFNSSLVGWNGHSEHGSSLAATEGL